MKLCSIKHILLCLFFICAVKTIHSMHTVNTMPSMDEEQQQAAMRPFQPSMDDDRPVLSHKLFELPPEETEEITPPHDWRDRHPVLSAEKEIEPEVTIPILCAGMWGSLGYTLGAYIPDKPLRPLTRKKIRTPFWEASGNLQSNEAKNRLLFVAHNTNSDIDNYLHWRANVAASLMLCKASLNAVQTKLSKGSEFVQKAVLMNDHSLLKILFDHGASQETGYASGTLFCLTKQLNIAQFLTNKGYLETISAEERHDVYNALLLPEYDTHLVSFYIKKLGFGGTEAFLFDLIKSNNPVDATVLSKATAFLGALPVQKEEAVLRQKNKDNCNIFGVISKCMGERPYNKKEKITLLTLLQYFIVCLETANEKSSIREDDDSKITKNDDPKGKEKE